MFWLTLRSLRKELAEISTVCFFIFKRMGEGANILRGQKNITTYKLEDFNTFLSCTRSFFSPLSSVVMESTVKDSFIILEEKKENDSNFMFHVGALNIQVSKCFFPCSFICILLILLMFMSHRHAIILFCMQHFV